MPFDERWLTDVLARGQVRLVGGAAPVGPPAMSERAFQAAVVRVAKSCGWQVFHPYDSRKSPKGYPDLTLARLPGHGRPGEVIWSELKVEAPLTIEQEVWLATLSHVQHTEAYLWTPEDWDSLVARLRG